MIPAVPGIDSSTIAAIVAGPSNWISWSRCCRARAVSSASVVGVELRAVEERPVEVDDALGAVVVGPATRVAGEVDRRRRVAVVAAVAGENLAAAGVQARHPDGVLNRVRATIREKHVTETVARGPLDDEPGGLRPGRVGVLRRDRREQGGLLGDRRDDLGVPEPEVGEDELTGEVEVRRPGAVPDPRTLCAGHERRAASLR